MKKTVFITGASRGIGAQTALYFAEKGYNVAINCMSNTEKAEQIKASVLALGGDADVFVADVSDAAQVKETVSKINARFGKIDVLINNAGIAQHGLFQFTDDAEYDRLFAVNVKGVFNCCREVLPDMIARKQGSIVNISSVLGITGASCEVVYSACKAAVIGMTSALAKEVGPCGIRVNCVAPGVIDTDMNACHDEETVAELASSAALCDIGSARQVAEAVFFLADSASFVTGQTLRVDGGLII